MKIALTFDVEKDIPNCLDTDFGLRIGIYRILNLLDEFQIKCTFFCTGTVVQEYSRVINLIESRGHEIACHSLNHKRLNRLTFEECKKNISISKIIIERICKDSEIIGFRAPYLNPPKFIFQILRDLGFKYDSSVKHRKKKYYQRSNYNIQEFYPLSIYMFFRLPCFYFIRKWIFKRNLSILYFHSWEAIDIKSLIFTQMSRFKLFKNYFFRLDRWINTGDIFIIRFKKFIKEALSRNVKFVTLKKLTITE